MTMNHLKKFMPPHRLQELDELCVRLTGYVMAFSAIPDNKLNAATESFPDPNDFYDGSPTAGDSKKFLVATLKASLKLLLDS